MNKFQIESIINQKINSSKKILMNSQVKLGISKLKKFKSENNKEKNNQYKRYDVAIEYYTKKIKNDKNNISLIIKRAICYLAKNIFSFAGHWFNVK